MNKYILYISDKLLFDKATILASFTNAFNIVDEVPKTNDIYIRLDSIGLALISQDFKPLYVKDIYSKLGIRQQNIGNELLIQAVKVNVKSASIVWDLTAGLGKDAFILASFGYQVTMVEQNPILATILYYALENKIIPPRNLKLVFANSVDFLSQTTICPQVIYLDPMFKESKTAKAKKDMQIIQFLADDATPDNTEELFRLSYLAAAKTVVKRDNKQECLVQSPIPSYAKSGKTIRFDVYLTQGK